MQTIAVLTKGNMAVSRDTTSCCVKVHADNAQDEAWLGYTYCNGTSNEWVGCDDNHGAATVTPTSPCWCPEETAGRIVPFNDASSLANVVSLPTATDGRLEWQGGFLPSTESVAGGQPTGGAESTSSSGSRPASISASTTVQSTEINGTPTVQTSVVTQTVSADTGSSSSGLSTAAKAGIGAGAGLAALALGALIIWILLRSRRRRRSGAPVGSGKLEKSSAASSPEQQQTTSLAATGGTGHKPQHGRYYDNQASAPAVFGHKSELDAVENKSTTPVIPSPRTDEFGRPRSELPADAGRVAARTSAEGRVLGDGGWEIPGQMGTVYEKPT